MTTECEWGDLMQRLVGITMRLTNKEAFHVIRKELAWATKEQLTGRQRHALERSVWEARREAKVRLKAERKSASPAAPPSAL